jgi:hypothetical protein
MRATACPEEPGELRQREWIAARLCGQYPGDRCRNLEAGQIAEHRRDPVRVQPRHLDGRQREIGTAVAVIADRDDRRDLFRREPAGSEHDRVE